VDYVVGDKLEKHSASVMTVLKPKTTHSEWKWIDIYGTNVNKSLLLSIACFYLF